MIGVHKVFWSGENGIIENKIIFIILLIVINKSLYFILSKRKKYILNN